MINFLNPLLYSLGPAAVLFVMAIVFAETGLLIGFFLPGDSLLFLAGTLVASNVINVPFWILALGVFVAAVLGDQVGYLIGRRLGPTVFSRPDSRLFRREYAEKAQVFFEKHGPSAIVLARFVPIIRTFAPMVAGVGRMSHRKFTIFNVIGALLWAVGIVTAGFYFGGIPFVAANLEVIVLAVVALSVCPALVEVLRHRRKAARTAKTDGSHPVEDETHSKIG